jgi:tryptophanyl-tRNA synthetase
MTLPVILTGLRANNDLHLGSYFGAMLPIIDMALHRANEYQVNMFIPDLHSFTTPIDHGALYDQILHNAQLYAAAGLPLDDDNIHLYRQSFIPAHSELTWLLSCFTGFGEMARMTQFKDKSLRLGDHQISAGLFSYPILMAADILLYKTSYVPVGDDQTQHLEFARDIAERMNHRFGDIFVVPKPVGEQHTFFGKDQGLRIMDLADPTKKMSKSDETGKGVIFLSDDPGVAAKKVMSATTDSFAAIAYDRARQPGITNLIDILGLLKNIDPQEAAKEFLGSDQYGSFKRTVADEVEVFLTKFQQQLSHVDHAAVLAKLTRSEAVMNEQANQVLANVQQALGLRRPKES